MTIRVLLLADLGRSARSDVLSIAPDLTLFTATQHDRVEDLLGRHPVDCVVIDAPGPVGHAVQTVTKFRALDADVAIVVLTDGDVGEVGPAVLDAGATDCLHSSDPCVARAIPQAVERQRLVLALDRAEGHLARAQACGRMGVWEVDVDANTVEWSQHMYDILGLDPATTTPSLEEFLDRIHPADRDEVGRRLEQRLGTGTPVGYQARIVLESGEVRWVRIARERIGVGSRLAGTLQDVTQEQRDQDQLTAYAIQQATVAELGRRAATGLPLEEIVETLVEQVAAVLDAEWVEVLETVPGESHLVRRAGVGWPDGGEVRVELGSMSPGAIAFEGGEPLLVSDVGNDERFSATGLADNGLRVGILVPVGTSGPAAGAPVDSSEPAGERFGVLAAYRSTLRRFTRDEMAFLESLAHVLAHCIARRERDRLAAQRRRDRQLGAIGQLAATVAHDFSNLMTVVSISAEMLSEEAGLSGNGRAAVDAIRQQGDVAATMMWQVLDFAQRAAAAPVPIDVAGAVAHAVSAVDRALPAGTTVGLSIGDPPGTVLGDAAQLQRVCMNLLTNARDSYHGAPGHITVEVGRVETDDDSPHPARPADGRSWARIVVSDSGAGIAPEVLPRIFDPFFTTKAPGSGTGLGLAHAKGVVNSAGGLLRLDSEVGKGTRVEVWLPTCAAEAATDPDRVPFVDLPRGDGELILVVDDDEALRMVLRSSLSQLGYRVIDTWDGYEAIRVLEKETEVRLVLAGVLMPGLGGEGLVRVLRDRWGHIPVVLMTSKKRSIRIEANARAVLAKPVSLADMARVVRNELGGVYA